jgi:hypothetical protein
MIKTNDKDQKMEIIEKHQYCNISLPETNIS